MASLTVSSEITLNLARPNSGVIVYAKQFDMGSRIIDINLVSGSEVWDPPSDCEIIVMFAKPDGTKGAYDVVEADPLYSDEETYDVGDRVRNGSNIYRCTTPITEPETWDDSKWALVGAITPAVEKLSTGKIRLTLAEQALTAAGNVWVEISFYTQTLRVTTLSFVIAVESGVPKNEDMVSEGYFNILSGLIQGLLGATSHSPQIDTTSPTKNWLIWDDSLQQYVDSGSSSLGTQGDTGPQGVSISSITRTNSTPASAGSADTYRVDLSNGESAGTFTVYQGANGIGSPDPGNQNPLPNGVASPGTDNAYARRDHVHPATVTQPVFDAIYPVGSVYISVNSTDPASLFGGTWEAIKDVFLLSCGDAFEAGETGGESTHELTVSEIPAHHHPTYRLQTKAGTGSTINSMVGSGNESALELTTGTGDVGEGQPHNNMPPYLAVYMWKRTA